MIQRRRLVPGIRDVLEDDLDECSFIVKGCGRGRRQPWPRGPGLIEDVERNQELAPKAELDRSEDFAATIQALVE